MKDRASHDGKGSVPHTSADTSLRSTFPARSAASRAVRHASLKKRAFVPQDKSSFFVCHVNTMDQFPSWWHKTVPQRSGHSFEARSSGASSHFVPLHHDPATRELIHSVRMTHSEMTFVCQTAAQARPPRQQRSSFVQTRNRFAGLRVCAPALAAGSRSGEALFSGRKRNRAKEQQYCRFFALFVYWL